MQPVSVLAKSLKDIPKGKKWQFKSYKRDYS